MIKLLILSALCVGFIVAKAPKTKDRSFRLEIEIAGNGCGCNDTEEEEDRCLNEVNSKEISKAVIFVIDNANCSYQVLKDLRVDEFMCGTISYTEFARHVKKCKVAYKGLKGLIEKLKFYKVCDKIACKVLFELREALRDNSASNMTTAVDINTRRVAFNGTFVVLSDNNADILDLINKYAITEIYIEAKTLMVDQNLYNVQFGGINITIKCGMLIMGTNSVWDVTSQNPGSQLK